MRDINNISIQKANSKKMIKIINKYKNKTHQIKMVKLKKQIIRLKIIKFNKKKKQLKKTTLKKKN